ncbi:MAG: RraA family protein [Spirochaetes bacterium]|nr:RraA family protein [Spirochaetota bacterium]
MYEPFNYGIPVEELRNRYSKLYSGLIYDVLDEMKIPNQALANDVKPLDDKWVLAGPAYTVKMESRPDVDTKLREYRLTMLDHMHPGMVEIRDCSHDEQAAHFGELNANIIRAKGCVGAVVDGGSRDSRFIKEMNFPVFCRYRNPVEALGRCVVTRVLVDIVMRGALTTGVTVRPWDYIFADMDGVIVIPREITKKVLEQCEHEFAKESESRQLYRDPSLSPLDIYKKLGKL